MTRRALLLCLVLLSAKPVLAQAPIRDAIARTDYSALRTSQPLLAERVPNRTERLVLKGCLAFNVFGNAYDATTTIRAIRSGRFVEGNPALRWIGDQPLRIVPVKAAYVGGISWGVIALAEKHPRIAALAACTSGAISAWAGGRNRRALQR